MVESPSVTVPIAHTFAHSRLYDLVAASPLVVTYGFACAGNIILISRQWSNARDATVILTIVNEVTTLLFFGLQIGLCLVRRLPVGKAQGLWPRAIAILGANFNFTLLFLPRVLLAGYWATFSSALTIVGTLSAMTVLLYLGRSFSIFPEARNLVIRGPYRYIRHPLYLTEMISTIGIMLQFRQPWAALIVIIAFVFQLRRMKFEESVLLQTYSSYARYVQETARLIPGLY